MLGEALGEVGVSAVLGEGLAPVVAAHALSSAASITALSSFFMRQSSACPVWHYRVKRPVERGSVVCARGYALSPWTVAGWR